MFCQNNFDSAPIIVDKQPEWGGGNCPPPAPRPVCLWSYLMTSVVVQPGLPSCPSQHPHFGWILFPLIFVYGSTFTTVRHCIIYQLQVINLHHFKLEYFNRSNYFLAVNSASCNFWENAQCNRRLTSFPNSVDSAFLGIAWCRQCLFTICLTREIWWTYTNAIFVPSCRRNLQSTLSKERLHMDASIMRSWRRLYFHVDACQAVVFNNTQQVHDTRMLPYMCRTHGAES